MLHWIPTGGWPADLVMVLVKSTLLLAAAWPLAGLLARRSAAERHLVWAAALTCALSVPLLQPLLGAAGASLPLPAMLQVPVRAAAAPALPAEEGAGAGAGSVAASAQTSGSLPTAAGGSQRGGPNGGARTPVRGQLAPLLLLAWLAGALLAALPLVRGRLGVRGLARRTPVLRDPAVAARVRRIAGEYGIRRRVRLLAGARDAMPVTFGVLRPSLLLPSTAGEWSGARLDAVLRHELAHIRRRDALTQLVGDACCVLYWFQPLAWRAAARLRAECEHACDDVVLAAGMGASDYAAELLDIARRMRAPGVSGAAAAAFARPATLRTRLRAVLEDRQRSAGLPRTLRFGAVIAAGVLAACIAAAAPATAGAAPRGVDVTAGAAVEYTASTAAGGDAPVEQLPAAPTPPFGARTEAAPAHAAQRGMPRLPAQVRECWGPEAPWFSGTMITRSATGSEEHIIIASGRDGTELCRRSVGEARFGADGSVEWLGEGASVVFATRGGEGTRSLVVTPAPDGLQQMWYVNGEARTFDADAREWRDALQQVLHVETSISQLRGQEASLRGRIASLRGQVASMRGQIASTRGQVASLQGRIASARGQEASLRGQISSLRAREGNDAETARRIQEIEARIRALDAESQARQIERQIREFGAAARVREIEARIADFDVESQVQRVEQQILRLDAERRVRELEPLRDPAHQRLEAALRRLR